MKDYKKEINYLIMRFLPKEGVTKTMEALNTLLQESNKEAKKERAETIYKVGLRYQMEISKMRLGEEESALLLDDFLKNIFSRYLSTKADGKEKKE